MDEGKPSSNSGPLLFIDTNILLDFYRAKNDAALTLLEKVNFRHNVIITSCHVGMEFKKNRQGVILEVVNNLKASDLRIALPHFLHESEPNKVIQRNIKDINHQVEELKKSMQMLIEDPVTHDLVFASACKLFSNQSAFNLKKESADYQRVYRKACKRFFEGKPPRKRGETSIGDAINWEWVLQCMRRTGRNVILASRDGDFGATYNNTCYLNDWLSEEVKEIDATLTVTLVSSLAEALKLLSVRLSNEELVSEMEMLLPQNPEAKANFDWIQTVSCHTSARLAEIFFKDLDGLREKLLMPSGKPN